MIDEIEGTLMSDTIGKAGTCGLVAAGGAAGLLGSDLRVEIPMLGRTVPVPALCGGIAAVSSVTSDYVQKNVFPMWSADHVSENRVAAMLAAGTSGTLTAGALAGLDSSILRDFGVANALFIGAGSELVGSYLWFNVIQPAMQ